jgi:hypothetical protein
MDTKNKMSVSTIIEIDNFLVSSEILTEKYICDIEKCRGACCIIGDSGAPLNEDECGKLKLEYDNISRYIRREGIQTIEEQGHFVIDIDNDLVTPLISGEECAYTIFDNDDICLCGIEKAHNDGNCTFKKPISCWLYPIRVSKLSNGMTALNLHRWHLCTDAYEKGRREGVPVFRFLKEPLIFAFGEKFYNSLEVIYDNLFK